MLQFKLKRVFIQFTELKNRQLLWLNKIGFSLSTNFEGALLYVRKEEGTKKEVQRDWKQTRPEPALEIKSFALNKNGINEPLIAKMVNKTRASFPFYCWVCFSQEKLVKRNIGEQNLCKSQPIPNL